jgi:RecA/RadA recombinase
MANKFLSKLRALEGAVNPDDINPLLMTIRTPSPSVNWAFGVPGNGLPFGAGMVLYGPPKGGKSIICNAIVGQLHKDDPDAIVIKFNTEMRGAMQDNTSQHEMWGIDPDRFVVYDVNQPEHIFDRIEQDLNAMIQDGAKIKLIIIDSLTGIVGRRSQNATTILTQQIGDQAATIKDGLMRILPTIRKNKIALIATAHVRAEMDQLEQMRGNTVKMAAAWAAKHFFEFFCYIEPNRSKTGKTNLAGEEFTDPETVDFMDKAQKTAHKIRFTVKESSIGPAGRTAEFTLDYAKGIINTYEEIFTLAKNKGILERPNNQMYKYGELQWRGIVACLTAIRDSDTLQQQLLQAIYDKK